MLHYGQYKCLVKPNIEHRTQLPTRRPEPKQNYTLLLSLWRSRLNHRFVNMQLTRNACGCNDFADAQAPYTPSLFCKTNSCCAALMFRRTVDFTSTTHSSRRLACQRFPVRPSSGDVDVEGNWLDNRTASDAAAAAGRRVSRAVAANAVRTQRRPSPIRRWVTKTHPSNSCMLAVP